MSTYLLAFIVSDYTYIEGYRQRVYSRPEYIANGDAAFALDVGISALEALESYTGINYTLSKMYQASIPQFSAGAMENWGLVTYRESALLFNKTTTTTSSKQSTEVVIAHEYAHQWFGDLVSPKWWKYIWLNEGFASYLQYYIGDKVGVPTTQEYNVQDYILIYLLERSNTVIGIRNFLDCPSPIFLLLLRLLSSTTSIIFLLRISLEMSTHQSTYQLIMKNKFSFIFDIYCSPYCSENVYTCFSGL